MLFQPASLLAIVFHLVHDYNQCDGGIGCLKKSVGLTTVGLKISRFKNSRQVVNARIANLTVNDKGYSEVCF